MKQRVLVLIKPDGMQKKIVGEVLNMFLGCDLTLAGLKAVSVTTPLAQKHYGHLKDKFFFGQIVGYLRGDLHAKNPVIAAVFQGNHAVKKCRDIAGATNPEEANPTSVRGKYGRITTKGVFENVVHVSSSQEEAEREIALWFKPAELMG